MSDHKKSQVIRPNKVCWHYTKGFCIYGGNCKFQHVKQKQKQKQKLMSNLHIDGLL